MYLKQRSLLGLRIKYLVIFGAILLSACNNLVEDEKGISIVKSISLASELTETSGLHCPTDEGIYTINDSGNSAVVYQLDKQGKIALASNIDHSNIDWEAITGDEKHLYIGDIGNNRGERTDINVVVLEKNTLQKVRVLNLAYENNSAQNVSLKHDFDGEALVSVEDKLFLFSKSWLTHSLHVYELSKTEERQTIKPVANLEGLPGVVTGADYNTLDNQFIIVGYNLNFFGLFSPFLAILNADFSLQAHYPLTGFSQVEGVCVSPSGKIWISQEGTIISGPKLAQIIIE